MNRATVIVSCILSLAALACGGAESTQNGLPPDASVDGNGGGDAQGDAEPGACPAGPQAPLGTACSSPGLECKYGYQPIECGGRTVACRGGSWVETEHTDPQPQCMHPDGGPDADAGADAAPDTDGGAGAGCLASGGSVGSSVCCTSTPDFPGTCSVGACSCGPQSSHTVKVCFCPAGHCYNGARCVPGGG